MKNFYIVIFLLGISSSLLGQIDTKGFNYQAVARDANGEVITNQSLVVEISVYETFALSELLWQEGHSVETDAYGRFTLVIGNGVTTGAGSVISFNSVDWSGGDAHVQVRIDPGGGLIDMGTTKLQSMPYAKYADQALSVVNDIRNLRNLEDVSLDGLTKNQIIKWDGRRFVVADSVFIENLFVGQALELEGELEVAGNNFDSLLMVLSDKVQVVVYY